MSKFNMTRRSFLKAAVATGAAAAFMGSGGALAVADETAAPAAASEAKKIRTCCRSCGKMECGVLVTVENGRAIRVEGDQTAFQSNGNCCTKSQAGIQAAYSPVRLHYPMKRSNPKTDLDPGWVRITWDEAFKIAGDKFNELKKKYGGECLFGMSGTSRCWSMSGGYGAIAQYFDTPNAVVPWQVCKGPRHFGTALQSSFAFSWQADVDKPRVAVRWGSATEISNYDTSCRMTVELANDADIFIDVDPRYPNLGKEADYWLNLNPGTDCALAHAWANVVIENDLVDDLFVKRWTNAPFLVCEDIEPSGVELPNFRAGTYQLKTRLLKESDLKEDGSPMRFMVWDQLADKLTFFDAATTTWEGETLEIPTKGKEANQPNLVPGVAQGFVLDQQGFNPEIDPALYGEYKVELKNGKKVKVKPVWEYYVELVSQFDLETASEITGLPAEKIEQSALAYATRLDPASGYGNGGIGYMLAIEHYTNSIQNVRALDTLCAITGNWDTPGGMRGPTLGVYTQYGNYAQLAPALPLPSPEQFKKISGGIEFPLLQWWEWWSDATSLWEQVLSEDPYPIRGGLNQSGDFMNMSNILENWEALQKLDFFVDLDLWETPLAGVSDIMMPVYHWLEVECPRGSQGSSGAAGAMIKCIDAPGECMFDVDIIIGLGKAMGLPYWSEEDPWPDQKTILDAYVQKQPSTDVGFKDWEDYSSQFQENGWFDCKVLAPTMWGTYRRYQQSTLREIYGIQGGCGLITPTSKLEIWSTVIESIYPDWKEALPQFKYDPENPAINPEIHEKYPYTCLTGRRIPVYFHSEHRQLPWCRELWPAPRMEINPADAEELGLKQGDWAWIENDYGKVRQVVDIYPGIKPGYIHCEHQWWFPELEQAGRGFQLSGINCLVPTYYEARCRLCGSGYLRGYAVNVYKATAANSPFGNPVPCGEDGTPIICDSSDPRLKEWLPTYEGRE